MRCDLPHYSLVPKDWKKNLQWRNELIAYGRKGGAERAALRRMASEDVLFWANSFLYVHEPRGFASEFGHELPLVTWEFQDDVIREMYEALGLEDVAVKKSRENTASWDLLIVFLHRWSFFPGESYLLVSRKEEYVDSANNLSALMPKLDFMLQRIPSWMKPPYTRTKLTLTNTGNGTTIKGESTNANIGRSGRFTAIGLDEFHFFPLQDSYEVLAATQNATDCRVFVSTVNRELGNSGAYSDVVHRDGIRIIEIPWWKHPRKRRGLYRSVNGVVEVLDREYRFPKDYNFVADGLLRSPYFDKECLRAGNDMGLIAAELNMDFGGSLTGYFEPRMIERNIEAYARPADYVGHLAHDKKALVPREFLPGEEGNLRLWGPDFEEDDHGRPRPKKGVRFAIGVDISTGTGHSNSCVSIGNLDTRRKVGEFVTSGTVWGELDDLGEPIRFNDMVFSRWSVALARWLNDAFVVHDAFGGAGRNFGMIMVEAGYLNLYYKKQEFNLSKKMTDTPGYFAKGDARTNLFGNYRDALRLALTEDVETGTPLQGAFINPSKRALEECHQFRFTESGIEHVAALSRKTTETDARGSGHGDIVFADCLLNKAFMDLSFSPALLEELKPPNLMTAEGRIRAAEEDAGEPKTNYWGFPR